MINAVLCFLIFSVPIFVLPTILDNSFETPKNLLILLGSLVMVGIYGVRYFTGRTVETLKTDTSTIMLFIAGLNLLSFFYTKNPYYTAIAATLNLSCLAVFYFSSLYLNHRLAVWLIAVSGLVVAIETWLQFFDIFLIFKFAHPGIMMMGTIGNSNFLGAYYVFPLFGLIGLAFMYRKYWYVFVSILLFIFAAFLFTRARASWMGFGVIAPLSIIYLWRLHGVRVSIKGGTAVALWVCFILLISWQVAPVRFKGMMQWQQVMKTETLMLRTKKYSAASWWMIKENPLFGQGLRSYRNTVYEAQATIEKQKEGFFKDYPEPKPRHVHNEYLEILNDGGILAGIVLLGFVLTILKHGWTVLQDKRVGQNARAVCSVAFFSVIAILIAAVFFFPFRINTTLFMTVICLGIMEGVYSRHNEIQGPKRPMMVITLFCLIIGILWFSGLKSFIAERAYMQYVRTIQGKDPKLAEPYIRKALEYDPQSTQYAFYGSGFYRNVMGNMAVADELLNKALVDFNGDITIWSIYYMKGLHDMQLGNVLMARESFLKTLYYCPTFKPGIVKFIEVNDIISKNDKIVIRLR